MRIISGELRSRRYDGKLPPGIRPTTDSNKETIFNILNNFIDFAGIRVCDICAGTGSLGFEALSRGATFCTFVDISSKSLRYIDSAAKHFGLTNEAFECIKMEAVKYFSEKLTNDEGIFDLIFIDPPYDLKIGNQIVNRIITNNYLKKNGFIISESSVGDGITVSQEYEISIHKMIGTTQFHFIKRNI